jgi:signal transduction histidine kinase/CheY-like chemotaxis protein
MQTVASEFNLSKFTLSEFSEAAVVFKQGASVAQVLERCQQQGCDLTVMVNRQGQPLGLLHLYQLLSYWDPRSKLDKTSTSRSSTSQSSTSQSSTSRPPIIKRAWLCPLPAFPTEQPWPEIIDQLTSTSPRYWAWVDRDQQFHGLIDRVQVLRWWQQFQLLPADRSIAPALLLPETNGWQAPEFQATQPSESPLHERLSGNLSNHLSENQFWLEQFPFPVLIYGSQGKVLYQNGAWQHLSLELEPATSVHNLLHELHRTPTGKDKMESYPRTLLHRKAQGQDQVWRLFQFPLHLGSRSVSPEISPETAVAIAAPRRGKGLRTADRATDWLVIAQDISEQYRLEQELVAKNADLVQLNRLKDEFLACISHELRSPLTSVLGLSSLLQDQGLGHLNERQSRYAQLIYRSGKHLMGIVNDILDLTRIETGQLELSWVTVTIAELCQAAFEQAQQVRWMEEKTDPETGVERQGPNFSLEVEPGLQNLVADGTRLKQMLVNLLSNALKFTTAEGRVGLRVAHWEGWIAFTVWDTGIGIPADKQHLIFQKFQQLENPMTRQFQGTGLGLVLTQRLARLHGGDVTFTSREQVGSQFTLLLPPEPPTVSGIPSDPIAPEAPGKTTIQENLADRRGTRNAHARSNPLTPNPHRRLSHRIVLVVETNVRNLEDVVDQLTDLDYRCIVARSGTEALEKARQLQPCAILLNPFLPLLSGWDVLTLVKSDPQTGKIPVIITATSAEQAQAHRHHADGFLGLPIGHRALAQTLERLTQPSSLAAPEIAVNLPPARVLLCLHVENPTPIAPYSDESGIHQEPRLASRWDLSTWLHGQNYRIIESDDLDQAELLARVWQPQVVLLHGSLSDPLPYLKTLSRQTYLTSLPLITLDIAITQAANQIPGLAVFPCLILPPSPRPTHLASPRSAVPALEPLAPPSHANELLQVIDVAINFAGRPYVLAIAAELLSQDSLELDPTAFDDPESDLSPCAERSSESGAAGSNWLQALMQYLQTAGLRGSISTTPREVQQKLQSHNIHLLVIDWQKSPSHSEIQILLQRLQAMIQPITAPVSPNGLPPVLLISPQKIQDVQDLTVQSMSHQCPMHRLLTEIHRILGMSH